MWHFVPPRRGPRQQQLNLDSEWEGDWVCVSHSTQPRTCKRIKVGSWKGQQVRLQIFTYSTLQIMQQLLPLTFPAEGTLRICSTMSPWASIGPPMVLRISSHLMRLMVVSFCVHKWGKTKHFKGEISWWKHHRRQTTGHSWLSYRVGRWPMTWPYHLLTMCQATQALRLVLGCSDCRSLIFSSGRVSNIYCTNHASVQLIDCSWGSTGLNLVASW